MRLPNKLIGASHITAGKIAVFCNSVMVALRVEEAVKRSGTKAMHGCAVVDRKTFYWCYDTKVTCLDIYQSSTFQPALL